MAFEDFRDNHGSFTMEVSFSEQDPCLVLIQLEREYLTEDFIGTFNEFLIYATTPQEITPMSTYKIQDLLDMDSAILDLIGFSLSGKIAGQIVGCSMRIATKSIVGEQSIDGFEAELNELRKVEADRMTTDSNGIEPEASDEEQLTSWLGCRALMAEAGYNNKPLSDTFGFILQRSALNTTTDTQLEELATASAMPIETLKKEYETKHAESHAHTKKVVFKALDIVQNTQPNIHDTPKQLPAMVLAAVMSGRKSAVKMSNNTEEAVASNILLTAFEQSV